MDWHLKQAQEASKQDEEDFDSPPSVGQSFRICLGSLAYPHNVKVEDDELGVCCTPKLLIGFNNTASKS